MKKKKPRRSWWPEMLRTDRSADLDENSVEGTRDRSTSTGESPYGVQARLSYLAFNFTETFEGGVRGFMNAWVAVAFGNSTIGLSYPQPDENSKVKGIGDEFGLTEEWIRWSSGVKPGDDFPKQKDGIGFGVARPKMLSERELYSANNGIGRAYQTPSQHWTAESYGIGYRQPFTDDLDQYIEPDDSELDIRPPRDPDDDEDDGLEWYQTDHE